MTTYNADNRKVIKDKVTQRVTTEKFDKKTGEKISGERTNTFMGREKEPPFLKMYLDDIEILHRLPKKSGDVLHELLKHMNYEGEININVVMKKRICSILGIKNERSINNYLGGMVKKDVLQRIGRGVYVVNPFIIAKGEWQDIKGLRVTYKENGKREVEPIKENEENINDVSDLEEIEPINSPKPDSSIFDNIEKYEIEISKELLPVK